jgi:uncharacterized protein (DUF1800 family)
VLEAKVMAAALPATSLLDASRLADQASFGASEALLAQITAAGPTQWVAQQFTSDVSRYTRGGTDAVHTFTGADFCAGRDANCWLTYWSHQPLAWDFFRNAVNNPDQLRQRVALALSQITVVSQLEVDGTYGLRNYHNIFLANAFGNYRTVLEKVALSPLMGDYLNNVNNDKTDPNENFARELLQLFSIGTCELNADGTLRGGKCQPTYDNARVRDYAYALTGWTYPAGGRSSWCSPSRGTNCRYYTGDMVPRTGGHDVNARTLLSGVTVPAASTAPAALTAVLDSLMNHPNIAPFVGRQLIQHLVTSNPSPAYVQRVATAFTSGRSGQFGGGQKGDLKATIAAVLLDPEARNETAATTAGRLREPVQFFAGVLRALNGKTDGDPFTYWWGDNLGQHLFRSPSVFNFYPPDYPVAGTALQGPQFALLNASTGLQRINYVNFLVYNGGAAPIAGLPEALATSVNLTAFEADAADPAKLVDRMVKLGLGGRISPAARQSIIDAVSAWTGTKPNALKERVKTAAYLVFASPQYQIAR